MLANFSTYKIKIKHKAFTNSKGFTFEETVAISFYDSYKKELLYRELGFVAAEDLYQKIKNNEPFNIDDCFVENFSLSKYRDINNLGKEEIVPLKEFSAERSIFSADYETDFSFSDFQFEKASFQESLFIKGMLNFSNTHLAQFSNNFSYCFFNDGNVTFYKSIFGNGDTIFKNSIFKNGKKNFQLCDFAQGKVLFENVDFGEGDVLFVNANFSQGDVSFKISNFSTGKVDFHYSKFGVGKVNFEKINFGDGLVDFRMVEFGEGKCSFNKTIFGAGNVDFEGAELKKGRMTFRKTIFGEGKINFENVVFKKADLNFDHTIFNADLSHFQNSTFRELSFKSCHLDNYFDLRLKHCESLILSDTIVRDIIDIKPYKSNVYIKEFDFSNLRLLGHIYIDWKQNNVAEIIKNQKNTDLKEKSEQFLMLKENFNNIGEYDAEDKAYVAFKRMEELVTLEELKDKSWWKKLSGKIGYYFRLWIFDKAGLYATDPVRVLLSMFVSYIFFSLLFVFMQQANWGMLTGQETNISLWQSISDAFYFSAITYLTVGYGDFSPLMINRAFAALEGFVGVFLMAYFTVAFVRKILR